MVASVRIDVSPVNAISAYDCVQCIHDTNENIATWDELDLAILLTIRNRRGI